MKNVLFDNLSTIWFLIIERDLIIMLFSKLRDYWKCWICFTVDMKDKNERYCLFDCLPCGYCIELKEPGDKKVAYCSTCELGCFLEDKTCCAPLIIPTVCCWCRTSETCVHFDDDVKIFN